MEWFAYRITGTTEYHFSSGTQYMNAVYDLKFLRAKTVMITVKSASRDQLSINLFNFDMVLQFLLLYCRLCTV